MYNQGANWMSLPGLHHASPANIQRARGSTVHLRSPDERVQENMHQSLATLPANNSKSQSQYIVTLWAGDTWKHLVGLISPDCRRIPMATSHSLTPTDTKNRERSLPGAIASEASPSSRTKQLHDPVPYAGRLNPSLSNYRSRPFVSCMQLELAMFSLKNYCPRKDQFFKEETAIK